VHKAPSRAERVREISFYCHLLPLYFPVYSRRSRRASYVPHVPSACASRREKRFGLPHETCSPIIWAALCDECSSQKKKKKNLYSSGSPGSQWQASNGTQMIRRRRPKVKCCAYKRVRIKKQHRIASHRATVGFFTRLHPTSILIKKLTYNHNDTMQQARANIP
jgi:hypothetical protein